MPGRRAAARGQRHAFAFLPHRTSSLRGHTAVTATSRQPALLVKHLETYLSELELWLRE